MQINLTFLFPPPHYNGILDATMTVISCACCCSVNRFPTTGVSCLHKSLVPRPCPVSFFSFTRGESLGMRIAQQIRPVVHSVGSVIMVTLVTTGDRDS